MISMILMRNACIEIKMPWHFHSFMQFLIPFTALGFVGAVEDTDAGDPADPPGVDPRGITTPLSKEAAQR